jgi:hypothetical protein
MNEETIMKKNIFAVTILLIGILFSNTSARAQGTLYLSNLGQTPIGSAAVGSDSWWGEGFYTGSNSGGYDLDSVQLAMNAGLGNPSGLIVSLYSFNYNTGYPGSSLGTFSGSFNPLNSGTYTYTASGITLLPNTIYFIVLTATTPIDTGSYEWNVVNSIGQYNDGWLYYYLYFNSSSGGLSWSPTRLENLQFAITATAVPEPSASWLLLIGGGVFLLCSRTQTPRCSQTV